MKTRAAAYLVGAWIAGTVGSARAADVPADPSSYQAKLPTLAPGDRLVLAAGDYLGGMDLFDMNGTAGMPISIEGPSSGPPARFLGSGDRNTINITRSSYVAIRHLLIDGQNIAGIDAIKAGGGATDWAHHITIEGNTITGHDGGETDQQNVGISTKIVAWDWVVRGNTIDGAGTGGYFGNSDGSAAFIGGLIEGNLFKKTLGYNIEIKYQNDRGQAAVPTVPTDPRVTIVRHNVFIKKDIPSPDGVRPNLLTDGFPDTGLGSQDHYEIYGNLFFHNDGDALFQGSGRVHLHDNVFVDSANPAIRFADHDGKTVIDALVYDNTIFSTAAGVSMSSAPSGVAFVAGNAIFSPQPLGNVTGGDNLTGTVAEASSHFVNPTTTLGTMDFFPKAGSPLKAAPVGVVPAIGDVDYDHDFNGNTRDFTYRGAYQGEGTNPGWALQEGLKPIPAAGDAGADSGSQANGGPVSGGGPGGGANAGSATAPGGSPPAANAPTGGAASGGCGTAAPDGHRPLFELCGLIVAVGAWRRRRRARRGQGTPAA